jgi:hypothetical protein
MLLGCADLEAGNIGAGVGIRVDIPGPGLSSMMK